ncbi:MAG: CIA30 family protein [Leptolyngbya sp. SIO1E4]|nr:CIA30 family protein [Leptolyngbya sp. SIO1E4]
MSTSTDSWNPLKLLETLTFFGEIPFVGNVRWLQQMLGATPNPQAPLAINMQPSSSVVLRAQDLSVVEPVRAVLSERGISTRAPLTLMDPALPDAASQRIVNTSAIVWVGTPGDEAHLSAEAEAIAPSVASEEYSLFGFDSTGAALAGEFWGAVDDVVMGGVSASGLSLLPGYARFSGTVSTANSGGFASVRTRNFEPPFNLADWQGLRLALRGDGQRYKVILRNSSNWDSAAYCVSVDTEADQWLSIDLPFSALKPTFRARTQPTAPPLNPSSVCSFQLMLSKFEYDGEKNLHFRPGTFSLDVRSIGVYRRAAAPLLVAIAASSAQATAYTTLLAQSGLAHQVVEMQDTQKLSDDISQILTAPSSHKS